MNHVDLNVARCVSKSNMKNLDKELMIFHITNFVRDIAIYKKKLLNRIDEIELAPINPPRQGKKCIVMDIDVTI